MRIENGDHCIDTDPRRLDFDVITGFLATSYWAAGIPRENIERACANSLCFGMYRGEAQVGFARVVSDGARFAWLSDVFVLESEQGHGLGKWLLDCVIGHPELEDIDTFLLGTRDAHGLYERHGFELLEGNGRYMRRLGAAARARRDAQAEAQPREGSSPAASRS